MRTRGHSPGARGACARRSGSAGEWGAVWVAIGLARRAARRRPAPARWLRAAAGRAPPRSGSTSRSSSPCAGRARGCAACRRWRARPASSPSRRPTPPPRSRRRRRWGGCAPGARLPLYGLAAAICLTRPYLGMHYPSDVLGGAALGLAIGRLWPGLRGKGAEDRLIDLAAERRRRARRIVGTCRRTPATRRPSRQRGSTSAAIPGTREDRHRRPAERRQDDAVQRADAGGGPDRDLPVHDRGAERGDRGGPGRAPGGRWRRRPGRARRSRRRSSSTTSPAWCGAPRRARAWATASWPRSARPTRSATSSAPTATSGSPTPRAGSTRSPTPRRSRPSSCSPTSSRPSAVSSGSESRRARRARRRLPSATGWSAWSRRSAGVSRRASVPVPDAGPGRPADASRR